MAGLGLHFGGIHGIKLHRGGAEARVGGHSGDCGGRGYNGRSPRHHDILRGEVEEDKVDEEEREAC